MLSAETCALSFALCDSDKGVTTHAGLAETPSVGLAFFTCNEDRDRDSPQRRGGTEKRRMMPEMVRSSRGLIAELVGGGALVVCASDGDQVPKGWDRGAAGAVVRADGEGCAPLADKRAVGAEQG